MKKIKSDSAINTDLEKNSDTSNTTKKNIFSKEGELVVDVFETQAEFVISSAIAGVAISDVDISIEKDMMIIKGERKNPHSSKDNKYLYQECYWGPFSKKIILPENINSQDAQAEMDKGVLTIKFPKIDNNINKGKVGIKEA